MPALYDTPRLKPFILAEANGQFSRENIVVTQSGAAVESGQLLARVDTGAGSFAMDAGATGNPTAGTITVGAAALPGAYKVVFNSATKFTVEDPNGKVVGTGTVGQQFNKGGLTFTLTAGGTAAVDGDVATLAIAPGTGKYVPYQANGAAGPAEAVNYEYLPAKTGDTKAVGLVRHCELNRFELVGLDASGEIDLAKSDVIVRGTAGVPGITTPAL